MKTLGNILWFIFGGVELALVWAVIGLGLCITVVGIPAGVQCFKIATLTLAPFKKKVEFGGGSGSTLLNILWILVCGWELAVAYIGVGIFCFITIIGIPFGKQWFKLASLCLFPFGATIEDLDS